jgi:SRSO17 transposase
VGRVPGDYGVAAADGAFYSRNSRSGLCGARFWSIGACRRSASLASSSSRVISRGCREECLQQAKGEAGLDQYQVRTWRACYARITLSMLALAWLAASKAQAVKRGSVPATPV